MSHLVHTHTAVDQLLNLLRCDRCSKPLHQPFTTGVCEHLVCDDCRSSEVSAKQSMCPVCHVPVHPRDFQQHPQVAQLVLVARRLRRLTLPDNAEPVVDVNKLSVTSLTDFPNPEDDSSHAHPPDASNPAQPRVVLKRAYSSSSSAGTLFADDNNLRDDKENDPGSVLTSTVSTLPSVAVTRLAHRDEGFKKPDRVARRTTRTAPVRRSVNASSLNADKAVEPGRRLGQPSKRAVLTDRNPVTNETLEAPIASPECSLLTDTSRMSTDFPEKCENPPPVPKTRSKSRRISERIRLSTRGSKSSVSSETDSRSARVKSSPSFNRLVRKLKPNSKGESVLHRAAIRGNLEQVLSSLEAGVSPNIRDHAGWTPLHEAVLHGHCEIASALLKSGATVDVPGGPDLDTPLHDAIQSAQHGCCELLLAHGASPVMANGAGLTPLRMIDIQLSRLSQLSPKSKPKLNELNRKRSETMESLHLIRSSLLKAIAALPRSREDQVSMDGNNRCVLLPEVSNSTFIERRRLRPVFLGTGLNRQQKATFTRVASMIHAQVVTNISAEVTHVITGASQELPESNHPTGRGTSTSRRRSNALDSELSNLQATCPRTLKFLHAVLLGCWVLSFDWIETCAHVKMRVEEEGFEVTGCSTTPHSGAPRRARLAREAGSLGLFHGYRLCLLGDFAYPVPPRDELAAVARSGGAMVVLNRTRCSPVRLARLAVESLADWELLNDARAQDGDDDDDDSDANELDQSRGNNPFTAHPLLILYDPGHLLSQSEPSDEPPYAVQVVSQAASLLRPLRGQTEPPLRAVPSNWLLDSAAEYCILPFGQA